MTAAARHTTSPAEPPPALHRFYDNLATKPWCGDDKIAGLVRPKAMAAAKVYIAPNQPALVHWLVFDLDHTNPFIYIDKNLPVPNFIVQNPTNLRSHLYYAISPVCVSENGRKKPINYMAAIQRSLAKALMADAGYTGRIAKNPLCPHWRTTVIHSHEYSLAELADSLDLVYQFYQLTDQSDNHGGRNLTLFHQLRYWSYRALRHYKDSTTQAVWNAAVLDKALDLLPAEPGFTSNEIASTAKSVAKWVWRNYTAGGRNIGVMAFSKLDIPLQTKQRLAARRTHDLRTTASGQLIVGAINKLSRNGKLPSKAAVARETGLSREQVSARYSHLFVLPDLVTARAATANTKTVKYATHQVTAPALVNCLTVVTDQEIDTVNRFGLVECLDEGD